ncbi:hypothetical protein FN846DRAFT_889964 [Sphaerosporella brunnea]|uniref:Uncharacterized protein n=1 Tax=Sphaerosporella brunnea TaxID=1250544 RepID=A0A5J5EXM1_9PEZI|nr:hypothetical protein FN846DRAFT_889964 [Sphaerosporella brunnea]
MIIHLDEHYRTQYNNSATFVLASVQAAAAQDREALRAQLLQNLSAEVQRLQEEVATIPSNDEDYPDPRVPHLSATKRTLIPHAPPTDDGKKLDDVSEPMQLPCGDVQWIVDNGTLDRHLLAEANREAFCLQRDGVHYMVPWMSFSEERTPTPCAPQWLDTAHGTMSVLLNPARSETEIRQIRRQNEEMMDGAATRSLCTDIQLKP